MISCFLEGNYEILTNGGNDLVKNTFPMGMGAEIFSYKVLEIANKDAKEQYQREHVTPYIYENSEKIHFYQSKMDYSKYRWTLDTIEDFELIEKLYEYLYHGKHDFYLNEIIVTMEKHPELYEINKHIKQKKAKE